MKPMYIFFFRKKIFYDVTNFIFGRSLLKYILNKLVDGQEKNWAIPCSGLYFVEDIIPPHPLRNGHICMKYVQCTEINGKSLFRFLVFELWSFKILSNSFKNYQKKIFVPEDAQCSETDLCMLWTVV